MDQVVALRGDVEELTGELSKLRRAFGRRTIALALIAVAFCVAGLLAMRAQAENERRIAENNARWCPLFAALNPSGQPPTTVRGRQVADGIRTLSREFACPQPKENR